jgi:HEAT repeat protein
MEQCKFERLLCGLWDPAPDRRQYFQRAYRGLDANERRERLEACLESDSDGLVWKAAYLLLKDDPTNYLSLVVQKLNSDNVDIRYVICGVFHDLKLVDARLALETLAEHDSNGRVRFAAIKALGVCGNEKSVAVLDRIRKTDQGDDTQGRSLAETAEAALNTLRSRMS